MVIYNRPYTVNIAPKVSAFLRRDVNKGFAEVKSRAPARRSGAGARDRGAGYRLEFIC